MIRTWKLAREISIRISEREDGGIRVWSDDVPGLVLSGPDKDKVLGDIGPALKALVTHNGNIELREDHPAARLFETSAAEITRLRTENAAMRDALEPFAKAANAWISYADGGLPDDEPLVVIRHMDSEGEEPEFALGDLRRARAALSTITEKG